ncbi:glycosyltransferase [Candidatus Poribacteria bacterium]|nr:glycosyltransferase [Candidatus Poribacteria bacterium]
MNILHLDTEKGFRGGEQQVLSLMRGLQQRGATQIVVTRPASELGERARAEGYNVRVSPGAQPWDPRALWHVFWLVRSEKIDVVHAHTANAHTLGYLAARRAPLVVTRRVDFPIGPDRFSRRKYAAAGQHFIAISTRVRDVLIEGGVPAERITIVPSGIDPARFAGGASRAEMRRLWKVEGEGPAIGFIGALVDHKDPLNLVRAAPRILSKLPGARIVFVGEGDLRMKLETKVRELNLLGRVLFTGWQQDVGPCLSAFDMFVMPSRLEGLCTSLLDAQAVGLPCVACRTGGIPDIIEDGVNGLLVPAEDQRALAEAVIRLWQDSELRHAFGEAGPLRVHERFTTQRMVEGNVKVYQCVLNPQPVAPEATEPREHAG